MLWVIIAGEGLDAVQRHVEACRSQYACESLCFSIRDYKEGLKKVTAGTDPILVFLEANPTDSLKATPPI